METLILNTNSEEKLEALFEQAGQFTSRNGDGACNIEYAKWPKRGGTFTLIDSPEAVANVKRLAAKLGIN